MYYGNGARYRSATVVDYPKIICPLWNCVVTNDLG